MTCWQNSFATPPYRLSGVVVGALLNDPAQLAALGDAAHQPLLHALERVRDELAVEHGVDRAPQADQLGAAGQRRGGLAN